MKIVKPIVKQSDFQVHQLPRYNAKLCIATQNQKLIIEKSSILYLKSDSNYCEIHMSDGKIYCCSKTLKEISSRLKADNFVKVHNSYVVNLEYLKMLDASYTLLVLEGEKEIPISKTWKESIKEIIKSKFD